MPVDCFDCLLGASCRNRIEFGISAKIQVQQSKVPSATEPTLEAGRHASLATKSDFESLTFGSIKGF